jgi:Uma2 family endonuclease
MHMQPVDQKLLSIEEYEHLADEPGYRTELSRGLLVREPQPGALHGEVTGRLYVALLEFVSRNRLGRVTNQTGFALRAIPRTVRGPDVAFIRADRLPAETPVSYWPFAPDLAVEVASPGNSLADLQQKTIEYFEAGTQQVWVIEPRTRTVTVYRSLHDITLLRETDTLEGGAVLPAFAMPVASLFEPV